MDLLNQIIRDSVDPDYRATATQPNPSPRWLLAAVAVLIGAMFAVSALQTTRTAPAVAVERAELISRVQTAEADQDQLRSRATGLAGENAKLRAAALGTDDEAATMQAEINRLEPGVAIVAVRGPGLAITVDDATSADDPEASRDDRNRVLDVDLQQLANGLWLAGAEAIAINGHRLSTLTAVRGAGDAITVDYRSLTRPYRIDAVGDARTLQARLAETPGGAWWNELARNRGMRYDIRIEKEITLAADPGMVLRYAKRARP